MKIEKAIAVVQRMGRSSQRRFPSRSRALTYAPPAPMMNWTWEAATAFERARFVRETRALGIMDWDLCDLFNLTPDGLAAIVRGKDWSHDYDRGD